MSGERIGPATRLEKRVCEHSTACQAFRETGRPSYCELEDDSASIGQPDGPSENLDPYQVIEDGIMIETIMDDIVNCAQPRVAHNAIQHAKERSGITSED